MPQMFSPETPEEARQRTLEEVGDISGVDVHFNQVLLAVYRRPTKTRYGIHLADTTVKEDDRQGKAGLVVKLGPGADEDDASVRFHGRKLKLGDWVAIMPADGWPININGKQCRLVPDYRIFIGLDRPDRIW